MRQIQGLIALAAIGSCVLLAALMQEHNPYRVRSTAPCIAGEKYIVVIIPSYNNIRWCQANIKSVLDQNYSNYHVIYIDDRSTDGTSEAVTKLVDQSPLKNRITIIHNDTRKGALANIYHAIHACPDKAIVATVDGDDFLASADVLQILNKAYDDSNVWLTYGQFATYPGNALGICHDMPAQIIKEASYRAQQDWFTSHLRTFYAGLFKKIKEEDLKFKGEFFTMTWDRAFLYPMMEMANGRIKFIDKILYIYNQANPLNDFRTNVRYQEHCCRLIQQMPPYQALSMEQAASFCIA